MKFIIFLLSTFFFVEGAVINNPEDDLRRTTFCLQNSGVSFESIAGINSGRFNDNDPTLKKYLLCVSKNAGFQDSAGYLQNDIIKMRLKSGHYSKDAIDEVVENCTQNKETPEETAFQFMKCVYRNALRKRYF